MFLSQDGADGDEQSVTGRVAKLFSNERGSGVGEGGIVRLITQPWTWAVIGPAGSETGDGQVTMGRGSTILGWDRTGLGLDSSDGMRAGGVGESARAHNCTLA